MPKEITEQDLFRRLSLKLVTLTPDFMKSPEPAKAYEIYIKSFLNGFGFEVKKIRPQPKSMIRHEKSDRVSNLIVMEKKRESDRAESRLLRSLRKSGNDTSN